MNIRSSFAIFLVGYLATIVASISICSFHGTNPCPCSNAIYTMDHSTCGNGGNLCSRCGGYQASPSMVYYNKQPRNDLYSCSTIVKPAFVPETCPCYCHVSPVGVGQDKDYIYDEPAPIPKIRGEHNPVDSVSLTLAQSLLDQSKCQIPESKIWFCPTKMVLNDLPKVIRKNIPEEQLFAMERDVIELKPRKLKWGWNDDNSNESASSDSGSSSSESDEGNSNEIKQTEVSYKEIGYDRIKVNDAKCDRNSIKLLPPIKLDKQRWPAAVDETYGFQSCPFVPGQVVLRKRKIKPFGDCNGAESYEDITNRFDSFVEKSRNKLFRNTIGWKPLSKFNGPSCL